MATVNMAESRIYPGLPGLMSFLLFFGGRRVEHGDLFQCEGHFFFLSSEVLAPICAHVSLVQENPGQQESLKTREQTLHKRIIYVVLQMYPAFLLIAICSSMLMILGCV